MFVAGSVADNLRLGAQHADDDSLWEALRRVALEERVRDLPGGLDCPVGEDGTTLSAGERARLALARVVLADRPWVFLDEPTAHLDPLTEQVIADTVQELASRAAVVMVAHRPAMVALADHVLSLVAEAAPAAPAVPTAASPSRAPTPVDRPADQEAAPQLDGAARALGLSTVVGALASASGVALTATAGWLIVQASTQPGVLTLLAAIVAVRLFGVARPVLRYVERLGSHDAALRLLARRRVEVYDAVVPLVPARLGRRRGDVLASIVDDVDSVVDRELRVRMPARSYAIVATLAALTAVVLLPPAGLVVALTCLVAGARWMVGGATGSGPSRARPRRRARCAVCPRRRDPAGRLRAAHVATDPARGRHRGDNQRSHRPRRTHRDDAGRVPPAPWSSRRQASAWQRRQPWHRRPCPGESSPDRCSPCSS